MPGFEKASKFFLGENHI